MQYSWEPNIELLVKKAEREYEKIWFCGIVKDVFIRGTVGIIAKEIGYSPKEIRRRLNIDYEALSYAKKRVTYSLFDHCVRESVENVRREAA